MSPAVGVVCEILEARRFLSVVPWAIPRVQTADLDRSSGVAPPVTATLTTGTSSTAPTASTTSTGASAGLKIVLKEGPHLKANPKAAAAFRQAADFVQSLYSDPVTIVIDAEVEPLGPGVIGQTTSSEFHFNASDYDSIRNLLVKDAAANETIVSKLPTHAQLKTILPKADAGGAYSVGGLTATRAELLALGMSPSNLTLAPDSDYDPSVKRDMSITFNSDFSFDYDRSDGIGAGKLDFTGAIVHEIAHGMGFLSEVDTSDFLRDAPGNDRTLYPMPLDLFRLRPAPGRPVSRPRRGSSPPAARSRTRSSTTAASLTQKVSPSPA